MDKQLQQRLLTLNREFYNTIAEPFDTTRLAPSAGKSELVRRLPLDTLANPTLVDIGCGNGRLAWLLDERGIPLVYVGVDANAQLLASARLHTQELRYVRASFVQADLADTQWFTKIPKPAQAHETGYNIVTCLATLHHLPGFDLRQAVVQKLADLALPGGLVAISTWQFLTSPRFVAKLVDWASVGIEADQTEPGDALLPWHQGGYAIRYVHQIDMREVEALAAGAGLSIEATYFADGKEGNLNLYALLRHKNFTSI